MKPNPIAEGRSFTLAQDAEAVQAVVLAAAINGDAQARARLPTLGSALEEPYRTVAAAVNARLLAGEFVDRHTVGPALGACRLTRCGANGAVQELTPDQVVSLLFATEAQPGQVEAYLQALKAWHQEKRQAELKERAVELARTHGDRPDLLLAEFEQLAVEARQGSPGTQGHACELLEMIPYVQRLTGQQKGTEFLGLDSGFPHLNSICNGLDTGLSVLAAPPGQGKTTLLWQVACQAAGRNQVPVVFVSMEQSKNELRAKALARLSKLHYRHILRGRLRSDDPQDMSRLLEAAKEYAMVGRYLTIAEGDDYTTVDHVFRVASAEMARLGSGRCLILVDYLQILPLRREDAGRVTSTRDRIDLHVSALRRVARRLDSPVVAISAENRAGYRSRQLDVFKESGGIEYSADVAMILTRDRAQGAGQSGECRSLDLNVVKNRNGELGVVKFKFYPRRAEFVETGRADLVEELDE